MSGRAEQEQWYESKNRVLLEKMPMIASQYYSYFKSSGSRTEASCFTYLSKLSMYFMFLSNKNINPNNVAVYKKIKPVDITFYIDNYRGSGDKKKGDSTVAVMFNAIKSFYSFLENNDYIDKNPCSRLKAPKVKQSSKPVSLTKDEINKVKNHILYAGESFYNNDENEEYWRLRDYLIFTLGCRTGLRCSAITNIDIDDINLEEKYIVVIEKGDVPRNIQFGDNTKELINMWLTARSRIIRDSNLNALFISKKRNRISPAEIGRMIHKYTSEVIPNKHITPHKMRSTCATNLWEETHDIYMVANQLGHKNLANTKRYTDIAESESRKVANIMDEL